MLWAFQWGADYERLVEWDEKNRHLPDWKTPSAITDKPELDPWEESYVRDYYTLTASRQIGMGLGPIPVSEVLKFCEHFDIEDSEDFLYIIQAMDNAYLKAYNEKQAQSKPADSDGGKSKAVAAIAAQQKGKK